MFPLSTGPEKSSGLQLVEWAVDICMLPQILLYLSSVLLQLIGEV